MHLKRIFFSVLLLGTVGACLDPVHSDAVDGLGGETNGEGPGQFHRAGQPCLTCHGGHGPGEPTFSVAGTIYATRTGTEPLSGAQVTLVDAAGEKRVVQTNRVGNFYIQQNQWNPKFPLYVRLDSNGKKKLMQTPIGSEGSCSFCHNGPRPGGAPSRMPPVFFEDQ